MKKSKAITLVLITAALASCNKPQPKHESKKVHMRSDTTASYTRTQHSNWFYAFRPYGLYNHGSYQRYGFYSSGLSERSNIGTSHHKSNVIRGGFGSKSVSVSS